MLEALGLTLNLMEDLYLHAGLGAAEDPAGRAVALAAVDWQIKWMDGIHNSHSYIQKLMKYVFFIILIAVLSSLPGHFVYDFVCIGAYGTIYSSFLEVDIFVPNDMRGW